MDYVSYFHFFESLKQIIHDVQLDFKIGDYKGDKFESEYKSFMNKLNGYCMKYGTSCFHTTKSAMISSYITEISAVTNYPHKERFEKLLSVTDDYLRKSA